jgi:hypothetical protein
MAGWPLGLPGSSERCRNLGQMTDKCFKPMSRKSLTAVWLISVRVGCFTMWLISRILLSRPICRRCWPIQSIAASSADGCPRRTVNVRTKCVKPPTRRLMTVAMYKGYAERLDLIEQVRRRKDKHSFYSWKQHGKRPYEHYLSTFYRRRLA